MLLELPYLEDMAAQYLVGGKAVWANIGRCSGDVREQMGFLYFMRGFFEGFGSDFSGDGK